MSIYDVIADRIKEGELYELSPNLGFQIVRRIIVSKEINSFVRQGPWQSQTLKSRGLALYADFDHYMAGMLISVAFPRKEKPYENKSRAFMRLLHRRDEEVWEIRSYSTQPSLRVFGRFADRDLFVALTWDTRANLGQPPWRGARIACKTQWARLFHAYKPFTGENLHDYISSNAVLV